MKQRFTGRRGQVAVEYALAVMLVAGIGSTLFLFYQGFVYGNLYGSAGDQYNQSIYLLSKENKSMGLEKSVSLPLP